MSSIVVGNAAPVHELGKVKSGGRNVRSGGKWIVSISSIEFPRVAEDLNQRSSMKLVLWNAYLGFGVAFRLEVAKDS